MRNLIYGIYATIMLIAYSSLLSGCSTAVHHHDDPARVAVLNYVSDGGYRCAVRNINIPALGMNWGNPIQYGELTDIQLSQRDYHGNLLITYEYKNSQGEWISGQSDIAVSIPLNRYTKISLVKDGSTETKLSVENSVLVNGFQCDTRKVQLNGNLWNDKIPYGQSKTVTLSDPVTAPTKISAEVELPDGEWITHKWVINEDILVGESKSLELTGEDIVFNKGKVEIKNTVSLHGNNLTIKNIRFEPTGFVYSKELPYNDISPAFFLTPYDKSIMITFDAQLPGSNNWVSMTNVYTGGISKDSAVVISLTPSEEKVARIAFLNKVKINGTEASVRNLSVGSFTWNGIWGFGKSTGTLLTTAVGKPVTVSGEVLTATRGWESVQWVFNQDIVVGKETIFTLTDESFSYLSIKNMVLIDGIESEIRNLSVGKTSWNTTVEYGKSTTKKLVPPMSNPITVTGELFVPERRGWKTIQWIVKQGVEIGKSVEIELKGDNLPITTVQIKNSAMVNGNGTTIRNIRVDEVDLTFSGDLTPGQTSVKKRTLAYDDKIKLTGEINRNGVYEPFEISYTDGLKAGEHTIIEITYSIIERAKISLVNDVKVHGVKTSIKDLSIGMLQWSGVLGHGDKTTKKEIDPFTGSLTIRGKVSLGDKWVDEQWTASVNIKPGETVEITLEGDHISPTLVQVENNLRINGDNAEIRNVELIELQTDVMSLLDFGDRSDAYIVNSTGSMINVRFEYRTTGAWKKGWYVHESGITNNAMTVVSISSDNASVTTLRFTNKMIIDGETCSIKDIRLGSDSWNGTIAYGKTSDGEIVLPQSGPLTVEGKVYINDRSWYLATWIINEEVYKGENNEIILEYSSVDDKAYGRFKNLCKEEITGGNIVTYRVRNVKAVKLQQQWDEEFAYLDESSSKSIRAGVYDEIVVEGEIQPESGGSWIEGTWTFYDIKISSGDEVIFDLKVDEKFRKIKK